MIIIPLQLASPVSPERSITRLVAELTNKAPRRLIDIVLVRSSSQWSSEGMTPGDGVVPYTNPGGSPGMTPNDGMGISAYVPFMLRRL
jgi:hypothetical protein